MSAVEPRPTAPQPSRQAQLQYAVLWLLAGLAVLALIAKIYLGARAAGLERDGIAMQQFINQSMTVSRLNVELIQLLANVAANTGDRDISTLLDAQGIQYSATQQK